MGIEHDVTINRDGAILRGTLHTPGHAPSSGVVVSHGFAGYGDSPKWTMLCAGLARAGIPALRFSHSGCGSSDGDFADTTLSVRVADLRAAMSFLSEEFGVKRFGLLGSSFGGVTALVCGADPGVRCALIAGTPSNFDFFESIFPQSMEQGADLLEVEGLAVKRGIIDDVAGYDVLDCASRTRNLCVLHGENDELLPVDHAQRIYDAAPEQKAIEILSGADHPFSDDAHRRIMLERCLHWFRKYL